jgi:prophage pi2 protein 40|nr:MAG TPA: tail assembly chaperone protein [Bacteriophage sp.]DAY06223.1 MAG TPA: tail assembly chaperone protein [Caudoviricetes sp.]
MRKIITVGEQEYELGTSAYTPIAYKQQFGKDYFQDLFSMLQNQSLMSELNKLNSGEKESNEVDISILSDFDMTFFNRLFWTFAKTANPHIKPYEQFFMEMESFPIQEVGPELMEMLNASMSTKKSQTSQKQLAKKSSQ